MKTRIIDKSRIQKSRISKGRPGESRVGEAYCIVGEAAISVSATDLVAVSPGKAQLASEFGGRAGPEPVRYGDWEKNGRCIDF